jgi:hypothetical protein
VDEMSTMQSMPAPQAKPPSLPNSRFGILSLVVAFLALGVFVLFFAGGVALVANGQPSTAASAGAFASLLASICGAPFVAVVGLAFGIVGARDRTKKKTLAVIGISANSAFLLGGILLLVFGAASSSGTSDSNSTATSTVARKAASSIDESQAGPTGTATEAATDAATASVGNSRTNPFPIGEVRGREGDRGVGVGNLVRPADKLMEEWNMFNSEAEAGMEWVVVHVTYMCLKPADTTCVFTQYEFRLVGDKGKIYEPAPMAIVSDQLDPSQELFGGGKAEAAIPFVISEDDENLVLIWDPGLGYSASYYEVVER